MSENVHNEFYNDSDNLTVDKAQIYFLSTKSLWKYMKKREEIKQIQRNPIFTHDKRCNKIQISFHFCVI